MRRKKEEGRRKKKEKSTKIFLISNDLRPIPIPYYFLTY